MTKLALYLALKLLRALKTILPLGNVTLIDVLLTLMLSTMMEEISITLEGLNAEPLTGLILVTLGARLSRMMKKAVLVLLTFPDPSVAMSLMV